MILNKIQIFTFSFFVVGILVLAVFGISCGEAPKKQKAPLSENELEKPLIEANKKIIKTERQQIDDYVARHSWEMDETGTGLLYRIYKKGDGEKADEGKTAHIKYSVSLLNGDQVYSSEELGSKSFRIGRGGVESGLEEGILLMRVGDRAKLILPSHLAFGLLGDQNKISGKTTLVYDLELMALN
jgi:FKBP-type peptidyl-prolyl cis-trans isomerase